MEKKLLDLKRLRAVLVLTALFLLSFSVNAQNITGKVTEENGEAIVGVNIMVKGTTNGTITDMDGNFNVTVNSTESVLIFTSIGFETQEVAVGNQTTINVTLKVNEESLDEVVVVGYGTMKKSDVSGSSISVSAEDISDVVGANIDNALQGKAAGVQVISTSGQPGAGMQVSIRGQGTLNQSNSQPLYVIDGVPVQNTSQGGHDVGLGSLGNGSVSTFSGLSNLNPDDIETMEVLKDASATAIYGSRAANGVVLITTKSGKKGTTVFEYSGSYGIQEQATRLDLMNLREFAEYSNDVASETAGRDERIEFLDPTLLGEGTNWQDAIFQISPMHKHQLSAKGGTEKLNFYISGGFFDQEGTLLGSRFSRYTVRVNLSAQVKPWLKVGTNTSFANSKDRLGLTNSSDGLISVSMLTPPEVPIRNTDGTWAGQSREGAPGRINPLGKALDEINKLKRTDITSSFYAEFKILPELKLRSEYAMNKLYTTSNFFRPTFVYGNINGEQNSISKRNNQNDYYEVKNILTYSKTFGDHSVTAMLGQEVAEWKWESLSGNSTGLSSNDIQNVSLGSNYGVRSGFGSGSRVSMFGRMYYGYSDKYNLTYTYRRDASSNFGPKNRWAPFHAVSASWRISNESFMDFSETVLSNLKLRIGWGQVGNDNIGGYLWGASGNGIITGIGQGYQQVNLANPYVSWETQESWNFGLDVGFLNNRINVIAEYYIKTSKDMLMEMQLPSYMGTSGNPSSALQAPTGNFGEIENKGFELTIDAVPVKTSSFKWNTNLQFSANENKLVSLKGSGTTAILGNGQWSDVVSKTEVGKPLYSFYGYKVIGVYQNYEDLQNSPRPEGERISRDLGVWIGDLKYQDTNEDGVINENDKTDIGSPLPLLTFGFSNTFSYKGIELSVFLTGSYGNKVFNYLGRDLTSMSTIWDNQLSDVSNRTRLTQIDAAITYPRTVGGETYNNWFDDPTNVMVANPGAELPRAIATDPADNRRISDRYIEDGSYVKIKSLSLAYNLPGSLLKKVNVSALKVYVNVANLYTFTKYKGMDPEVGISQTSDNVMGLDNGRYPTPRIYTCGLKLTF